MNELEHPEVTSALNNGYPSWQLQYQEPRCPCCGAECDTIYFDQEGTIVGCDSCVTIKDAVDVDECYDEDDGYDEYAWQERKEF